MLKLLKNSKLFHINEKLRVRVILTFLSFSQRNLFEVESERERKQEKNVYEMLNEFNVSQHKFAENKCINLMTEATDCHVKNQAN